ncbi:MAG: GAF domain-containing SpoIIE family protein phosphatase [Saprospiraceae bacterium]|nr:GAF domain-containing SpoIIE family protein phosphatase [Saprospiraceae bacterium]
MAGFSEIKKDLSKIGDLEQQLNIKQLQINQLLSITQAINSNLSADGLFDMYRSFLSWEVGVKKMVLYVRRDKGWSCATSIGVEESLPEDTMGEDLQKYTQLKNLEESEHPLISEFDVIIPVRHKDEPIAYVLIGGFGEEDDLYNKVQFITTITNIVAVAIENKRLFKRQLEQERLKREMELAGEMQRMLIPHDLPRKEAYELASIYRPHFGVGGDYFDFIEFEDDKIAFCIGDISGKGIAAALLMANFQANFHTLINLRENLDTFIRDLNRSINRITKGERFITFFIAEYNIKERYLRYINAGHNPPVLVADAQLHLLNKGCTILGSFKDLPEVEIGEFNISEEAVILTFTDGLTDLKNEGGEYLDEQYLYEMVKKNYRLSAPDFNDLLMKEIEQFKGEQNYPDDFTVLTCKIY